jgi:hypothetical protein
MREISRSAKHPGSQGKATPSYQNQPFITEDGSFYDLETFVQLQYWNVRSSTLVQSIRQTSNFEFERRNQSKQFFNTMGIAASGANSTSIDTPLKIEDYWPLFYCVYHKGPRSFGRFGAGIDAV